MNDQVTDSVHPASVLAHCRQRIDRIDGVLLALLRERVLTAIEAAEAKSALGEPVLVPSREAEVLTRVATLASPPLEPDAVGRIFETIIAETRQAEERMILPLHPSSA